MIASKKRSDRTPLFFPAWLKQELGQIFTYPLTYVEAGSGFGKTTAVSEYLRGQENTQCYWYTCLGGLPEKAWVNICALFAKIDPRIAGYLSKIFLPALENLSDIPLVLGELSCPQRTVLVIDNYQLAGFEEPLLLLEALSLHGCDNLHIVAISQPLYPAANTTQSPYIHRLNQDAFYFDAENIAAFFKKGGVFLDAEQAQQIFHTTEGWIAALRLLLQQYQETGSLEKSYGLSSLMDKALWNALSEEERDFFFRLSVFDSFTPRLAAAVLKIPALPESHRRLLQTTAFVRWDDGEGSYTFHSLLSGYLQEKMALYPESVSLDIWKSAGEACASCGEILDAARFFIMARDWASLLQLSFPDKDMTELVRFDDGRVMERFMSECPRELMSQYPESLPRIALTFLIQGREALFGALYQFLGELCTVPGPHPEALIRKLRGQLAFLHNFIAFNDVAAMTRCHEEAYELLKGSGPELFTIASPWTFGAPSVVYMFWRESGSLRETLTQVEEGMPCYYKLTGNHGRGAESAMKAEILLQMGDDVSAETVCYKTYFQAERYNQDSIGFCADLTMGRVALLRGDAKAYREALENMRTRGLEGNDIFGMMTAEICRAFLDAILGRVHEIPAWLLDSKAIRSRVYRVAVPFCGVIFTRYLLEQKQQRFEGIIGECIGEAEELNMLLPSLYYTLYLAVEKERMGEREKAMSYLSRALDMALPDLLYLPFAELYNELEPLLKKARQGRRELLDPLIELGERMKKGIRAVRDALAPALAELTPREREIALLVKNRMSVKEIASRLFISESTVKNTMQKIYSKLQIHSKLELEEKTF